MDNMDITANSLKESKLMHLKFRMSFKKKEGKEIRKRRRKQSLFKI